MDTNSILTANLLDIIFEGKNKDYGAYDLRKSYNKRISVALFVTLAIIALLCIGAVTRKNISSSADKPIETPGLIVQEIAPPTSPPPPILPLLPPQPPVATIAYPPPLVVKDNDVTKLPPEIKDLLDARIDIKTSPGIKDIGMGNPPEDIKGSQVIIVPVERKKDDTLFLRVEIEASFPGGAGAWLKYVSNAVEKNVDEFSEQDYGTCTVRFIVDKSGKVSNIEPLNMKNTKLAEIAVNSIKRGPDWIPAQQNGRFVNAYRQQPVTLKNPDQ
ncbi:MAG: energy transducer TonB [Ginsengibacter sp.]